MNSSLKPRIFVSPCTLYTVSNQIFASLAMKQKKTKRFNFPIYQFHLGEQKEKTATRAVMKQVLGRDARFPGNPVTD